MIQKILIQKLETIKSPESISHDSLQNLNIAFSFCCHPSTKHKTNIFIDNIHFKKKKVTTDDMLKIYMKTRQNLLKSHHEYDITPLHEVYM